MLVLFLFSVGLEQGVTSAVQWDHGFFNVAISSSVDFPARCISLSLLSQIDMHCNHLLYIALIRSASLHY